MKPIRWTLLSLLLLTTPRMLRTQVIPPPMDGLTWGSPLSELRNVLGVESRSMQLPQFGVTAYQYVIQMYDQAVPSSWFVAPGTGLVRAIISLPFSDAAECEDAYARVRRDLQRALARFETSMTWRNVRGQTVSCDPDDVGRIGQSTAFRDPVGNGAWVNVNLERRSVEMHFLSAWMWRRLGG